MWESLVMTGRKQRVVMEMSAQTWTTAVYILNSR